MASRKTYPKAQELHIVWSRYSACFFSPQCSSSGSRIHTFTGRNNERSFSFIRILVFLIYTFAITFVATAAILQSGLDLSTLPSCRAAVYICLVFYVGSKVLVQLFLVERAHAVRYRLKRRLQDWMWLVSVAIIVLGFGTIAGVAFAYPFADIGDDFKCRIGVPRKVTVPLIIYDILINVALTAVFVVLLQPLLRFQEQQKAIGMHLADDDDKTQTKTSVPHIHDRLRSTESDIELTASTSQPISRIDAHPSVNSLKILVYKSLAGAVAIMLPTVINLGLLFRWKGQEQGWLCFTLCTLDVTWNVAVLHYLTVDHREDNVHL
ncbi:hypothetical protein MBLNU13_g05411t3 [Cladosporium sp. NU13]